jgi:hypothetical protein
MHLISAFLWEIYRILCGNRKKKIEIFDTTSIFKEKKTDYQTVKNNFQN